MKTTPLSGNWKTRKTEIVEKAIFRLLNDLEAASLLSLRCLSSFSCLLSLLSFLFSSVWVINGRFEGVNYGGRNRPYFWHYPAIHAFLLKF